MSAQTEPALVRFAREYGWRAYAIPVLLVITIWVIIDVLISPEPTPPQPQAQVQTEPKMATTTRIETTPSPSRGSGPIPAEMNVVDRAIGELPPGGDFTRDGDGTYRIVGTPGEKVGEGRDVAVTYVVEVENGVDTAAYGGDDAVAAMIDATLNNPQGWTVDPAFSFQHVGPDQDPSMRIQLTSVGTTHKLCGDDLKMETSCYTSDGDRVVINESRWVRGAITAEGDLGRYRQYLINHEVGHGIGFAAHAPCVADGELAPIMMQQTLALNNAELHELNPDEVYENENVTCAFNPWPFPKS